MTATALPQSAPAIPASPGKVRVGPAVSVVFEDRHSLWLRMQELMRYARTSGVVVDHHLDWYRRLMPEPGRWPAAIWIGRLGSRATPDLARLRTAVSAGRIELTSSAGHLLPATHLPHRLTDRLVGLIGWAEFLFDPALEPAFANRVLRWHLRVDADGYSHQSEPLVRARQGFLPCPE